MIKYNHRYWIDSIPENTTNTPKQSPFHRTEPPAYTRIEVFDQRESLCDAKYTYHTTQYDDIFISYTGGFDMRTGEIKLLNKE